MKTSVLSCVLLGVVLASLPACIQTRRDVGRGFPGDAELAQLLELGVSTKAQVLDTLGAPVSIRRQFDGDLLLWHRLHEESESLVLIPVITFYLDTEGSSRSDRLALLFDHDGVLAGIGIERDAPAAD
jgi:outer membrane protein assembly factor BamE (lipoprotein component of BamABCDE complex)